MVSSYSAAGNFPFSPALLLLVAMLEQLRPQVGVLRPLAFEEHAHALVLGKILFREQTIAPRTALPIQPRPRFQQVVDLDCRAKIFIECHDFLNPFTFNKFPLRLSYSFSPS